MRAQRADSIIIFTGKKAPWPGFEPGIARVTAEHTGPDYTTRADDTKMECCMQIKITIARVIYLCSLAIIIVAVKNIFGMALRVFMMNASK